MNGFGDSLCTVGLVILVIILIIIIIRRITGRRSPTADTPSRPSIGGSGIEDGPHRPIYDDPDIESGASIGGGPSVQERPAPRQRSGLVGPADSEWSATEVSYQEEDDREDDDQVFTAGEKRGSYRVEKKSGRVDSPDVKSGGSFGG